ncbi:MAG: SIR2 family protein [Candidatus Acidiferrales bacterium]
MLEAVRHLLVPFVNDRDGLSVALRVVFCGGKELYDVRLIRKINQGRAFALIGSGPSSEMHYPSWQALAEQTKDEVERRGLLHDPPSYAKYLAQKKYPELLSQTERDLGSRGELVAVLRNIMGAAPHERGYVYEILTSWPFACYITTNWDDEIARHLRAKRTYFETLGNSKDELARIRSDTSGLVVKLHSDLAHPDQAVITAGDYSKLLGDESKYLRDRLEAIFQMFDVLIVGHSLSDPDLNLVLQIAKLAAHPEHPVFLIAADLTAAEVRDYLERFNIVAMSYSNADGDHAQLRRTLGLLDKFIIPRHKRIDLAPVAYTPDELVAAQAIAIYRRLTVGAKDEFSPALYLGPLVLRSLRSQNEPQTSVQLLTLEPLSVAVKTEETRNQVPMVLKRLESDAFIVQTDRGYKLTDKGLVRIDAVSEVYRTEEKQAFGQFAVEVQARYSAIESKQQDQLIYLLQDTLVRVFKHRGLSIANAVFAGQSFSPSALSDVFAAISSCAVTLSPPEVAIAFMEASEQFLLGPTEAQQRYLASVSQGYFLYHLFGLDPSCAKIRREVFESTIWWCDSSTVIPLLAEGCGNHEYASDLFARLQNLRAHTLITGRLVREVLEHLAWAITFLQRERLQSPAVLEAATQKAGYKQNLFLDGYIRLSAVGKVGTFSEYVELVAPHGATFVGIAEVLNDLGIRVINAEELVGFEPDDTRAVSELVFEITEERKKSATLRSGLQVDAEAEILHIIRNLRTGKYEPPFDGMELEHAYFLSQSRILDRIPPADPISWTPEVLYRYIISLPGEQLDPDLLQSCMLQEYFRTGIVVIDKVRYERFFGPSIEIANTTYRQEKEKYLRELSTLSSSDLDEAFSRTPDLEKPFFVQQLGWRVADEAKSKADAARKRAEEAERQLQQLKLERDAEWKRRKGVREKQVAAESRNALDPKRSRKRVRQAKKRKRKK